MTLHIRVQGADSLSIVFGQKHYVQGLGFLNPRRRLLQIRISSPQSSTITYFANMIKQIDYTDSSDPFHSFSNTSVSYTHLRAHETRHDLVCRLLLEKK